LRRETGSSPGAGRSVKLRGRPIFWSGSSIISFHCAIQPTVRRDREQHVNIASRKPIALSVMPE